jgi:hypothetical protein
MINIPTLFHNINLALVPHFITRLISYAGIVIWLLPPFRQYKGGYFLFFLVLALTDPIANFFYTLFKYNLIYIYVFSSFILLFVAINHLRYLKTSIVIVNVAVSLFSLILLYEINNINIIMGLMFFFHFEIFCCFIIFMVQKLVARNIFYSYFLVLVFYEFSILVKFITFIIDRKTGAPINYLMDIIELFIGAYFILFNLKTGPRIRLKPQH